MITMLGKDIFHMVDKKVGFKEIFWYKKDILKFKEEKDEKQKKKKKIIFAFIKIF